MAETPRWVSFVPGTIWGCWLLVLSGFGAVAVDVPNGLHVTVWTAVGGLLVLGVVTVVGRSRVAWPGVVRAYAPVGMLELAQNGAFLVGAVLLLERFPLAIPLIRLHTSYLILVVGALAERAGWARGEPITRRKLVCAGTTVVGLALLSIDKVGGGVAREEALGMGLLVLSAVLSSVQHFVQARRSVAAGRGTELPGTVVQLGVIVVIGLPVVALAGTGSGAPDASTVLYLLAVGTVTSGAAFLARFLAYTRARISSFEMAIRQELEYVLQAVTAVLFLGAVFTGPTAVGSLLVLAAAIAVVEAGGRDGPVPAEHDQGGPATVSEMSTR